MRDETGASVAQCSRTNLLLLDVRGLLQALADVVDVGARFAGEAVFAVERLHHEQVCAVGAKHAAGADFPARYPRGSPAPPPPRVKGMPVAAKNKISTSAKLKLTTREKVQHRLAVLPHVWLFYHMSLYHSKVGRRI